MTCLIYRLLVAVSLVHTLYYFPSPAVAALANEPYRVRSLARQDLSRPLRIYGWDNLNCRGKMAFTDFDGITLSKNTSTHYLIRSFMLSRALQGQEQLDISITSDLSSWYPEKDHLARNSSSCNIFLQSYFANNGSDICHNTPPYTCSRVWLNPGRTSMHDTHESWR